MAGRLAGESAVDGGDYAKEWDALQGWQMRAGYRLHLKVCAYRDEDWNRVLGMVSQMRRSLVLQALSGELTPRFAAKLVLTQPLLAVRSGRSLGKAARSGR